MSEPTITLNTGNTSDDDGQVLDDLFEPNPNPPTPPIEAVDVTPDVDIRIPNRMLEGREVISHSWTTFNRLLPADVNRQSLTIGVVTTNATDYVEIVSDPAVGQITGKAPRFYACDPVQVFDCYTGPLYVRAVGSAAVELSYWMVTK